VRVAAPSLAPAAGLGAASVAGLGFLLLRPGLEGLGAGVRTVVLAAGYLGLAACGGLGQGRGAVGPARGAVGQARGGLGRARSPAAAPLGAWTTLAAGLLAVLTAALRAGPAPPLPAGGDVLALGLLAAVAEEALFRGVLYAWVERRAAWVARRWQRRGGSAWRAALSPVLAVAVSSAAFALVHLPSYGLAALPVDFGAGLLLGWQRWASGRWTVPAATHAAANLLAVILR
jgi:membrane protease YdiL (CAAX protease family)